MFEIQLKEFPIFLSYLWEKKKMELITHLIILFILPTLPYIFIAWKILQRPFVDQTSFFGDGSMISLCIGIICAYFGKTHDFKNEREKAKHRLFNVLAVIIYIGLIAVFVDCQLSTPRSQIFIWSIIFVSVIVLLVTVFISLVLSFDDFPDFQSYKQESRLKDAENSVESSKESKTKIKV